MIVPQKLTDASLLAEASVEMHMSDARGIPLLHDGDRFGADIIEFPPHGRVEEHTHPGAHMLFVLSGSGQVVRRGVPTSLASGKCYLVASEEPHSVAAGPHGLRLLVVGNDHRHVGSRERLQCS